MAASLPEVALLLVGQLRGFLRPEVQESVTRYAMNSTAGVHARTQLFVLLKLAEREVSMSAAAAQATAVRLGAARVQLVVADGDSSYNDDRFSPSRAARVTSDGGALCPLLVRNGTDALFHRYRAAWRDLADAFAMVTHASEGFVSCPSTTLSAACHRWGHESLPRLLI